MPKEIKKNKWKISSVETKIKILDLLRYRERVTDAAKFYCMNEATISTIRKNADCIRSVAAGFCTSMTTTSFVWDVAMENMKKALMTWLEDQIRKQIPLDTNTITNKALKIYENIKNQLPSSADKKLSFSAIVQRHSLHNLEMKGLQIQMQRDIQQNLLKLLPSVSTFLNRSSMLTI